MAQEGRPRPTDEAVNKLQDILATLKKEHQLKLMSNEDEVKAFGHSAVLYAGHLY
jgi:hypothetical protein